MYKKFILAIVIVFGFIFCLNASGAAPDSKNYRSGIEAYEDGIYTLAMKYFNDANKEFPNNGYVYNRMSHVKYMTKSISESYALALQALQYFTPNDKDGVAETYLHLAFLATFYANELNIESPIVYYDKAVNVYPEYYEVWLKRGVYLDIYLEDFTRSNADFRKAIELAPNEVEPYTRLGQSLYSNQNNIDEAIKVYQTSINTICEYPYHHSDLAELLIKKGQANEAAKVILLGIDMVDECIANHYVLRRFPSEQKEYLRQEIEKRAVAQPDKMYWSTYLDCIK